MSHNRDAWAARFVGRPALQATLHGDILAMATQPDVQSARTFTELVTRSRVPLEFWYAPKIPPKVIPVVPPDVATDVADRVAALKATRRWTNLQLAEVMCVSPGALWRLTHKKIHHDEVDGIVATLTRLESMNDAQHTLLPG